MQGKVNVIRRKDPFLRISILIFERIILGSHIEPRATKSNPRQEFDESLRPGERMKGKFFDPTWSEKIGK